MLAVTGTGMVSALGLDGVTSCAAARAGITRIGPLDGLSVYDEEAEELVPLLGHQVPLISAGMFGFARLLQLAIAAIDDHRRSRPAADATAPVGLILLVRSEWHRTAFIERLRRQPPSAEAPGAWAGAGGPVASAAFDEGAVNADRQRFAGALLSSVVDHAGLSVEPRARRTISRDQAGFVAALEQAESWLDEGTCEACWVLGVDSYLDPPIIGALSRLKMLKTPSHPVGLFPGEMACLLEVRKSKRQVPPNSSAIIEAFAQDHRGGPRVGGEPPDAEPLLRAMAAAGAGQARNLTVVNLNGTAERASEWGLAVIGRQSHGLGDGYATWVPPLHFGEIGSATGPASVALLAYGWARGYAPSSTAMVCLMEEGPTRGAISVSRPQ